MKVDVKGNKNDLSAMLVSAVKYALGRKTYMVNWTCEFISNNKHLLTEKDRLIILDEIKSYYKEYNDWDKEEWTTLQKKLSRRRQLKL